MSAIDVWLALTDLWMLLVSKFRRAYKDNRIRRENRAIERIRERWNV